MYTPYARATPSRIGNGKIMAAPGRLSQATGRSDEALRAKATATHKGSATEGKPMPPETHRLSSRAAIPVVRARTRPRSDQAMRSNRPKAANHTTARSSADHVSSRMALGVDVEARNTKP